MHEICFRCLWKVSQELELEDGVIPFGIMLCLPETG